MPKSCGTCSHARFQLTPTGRFKANAVGRCSVPAPEVPPLASCFVAQPISRRGVWPDEGADCVAWEAKP